MTRYTSTHWNAQLIYLALSNAADLDWRGERGGRGSDAKHSDKYLLLYVFIWVMYTYATDDFPL